ncbi:MAG: tetratricopeptide repeat protein [Candidatus Firestonebacteria bacterium]|nr:tetratricopeptide repeat protein [Candidatus Firestonebacteria bacterium]
MRKAIYINLITLIFFNNISYASTLDKTLGNIKTLYKDHKYDQSIKLIESDYELGEILDNTKYIDEISINYQYLIARTYHQAKNYSKAIDYYFLVTQKETVLSDYALFHMAECYQINNKYHYAINYYELLIKKYPNSSYLNDSYFNIAICYEKNNKYRESIDILNIISEKSPSWNASMVLLKKGEIYELMTKWMDAFSIYQKIISLYPKSQHVSESLIRINHIEKNYPSFKFTLNANYIWDRGMAYFYNRDYKNAIAQFKEIIDKKMDKSLNNSVYNMIGKSYYKRFNFWKAIDYFKIATQSYSDNETYVDSLFELANSYMAVKNGDSALWLYKKIDTEYSYSGYGDSALFKIAGYYESKKNHTSRIETYLQLIEKYPQSTYADDAYWYIACIYMQQNNLKEAIKYFNMLYTSFPQSSYAVEANYWNGKCYEKMEDWTASSKVYKELLSNSYNSKNFFYYRAKEKLNWINANKFKSLKDEEKIELYNLATNYYKNKQYDKAIENFKKIINLYDNTDLALNAQKNITKFYQDLKVWPKIFENDSIETADKLLDSFIENYNYTNDFDQRYASLNTIKELLSLGLYDEASNEIQKLRRVDYKDVELLYTYIVASKENQQYYKAIASTESLIRLLSDKDNKIYIKDETFLPAVIKKFLYPNYFSEYVEKYSQSYNIDPFLAYAVIREESRFKTQALSRAKAFGLMQIISPTGKFVAKQIGIKRFSVDLLNDPETNVKMGIWYLRYLLDEFKDNKFHALAAYNGGPENVKRWIKKCSDQEDVDEFLTMVKFNETHDYVKKVMYSYNKYKEIYTMENP